MNTLYDYFLFTPRTKHFLLPEVAVRTSTHNAVPHFSFQITFSPHSLNRHILTVSYSASLWGILSSFVLFYGFQWCCTQHSPADILISYLISCCKTPSHCWWDITLRRSTLKKKKRHFSWQPSKTIYCELLSKNMNPNQSLEQYCKTTVGCLLERGQSTVASTNVWMKQRNSEDFLSPRAPLPTRPPVSGEYGRLDSPWRVRSHLETLGQPKAGTVTITPPQSPWALTRREELVKKGLDRKSCWAEVKGNTCHYQWPMLSQREKAVCLFH